MCTKHFIQFFEWITFFFSNSLVSFICLFLFGVFSICFYTESLWSGSARERGMKIEKKTWIDTDSRVPFHGNDVFLSNFSQFIHELWCVLSCYCTHSFFSRLACVDFVSIFLFFSAICLHVSVHCSHFGRCSTTDR